jgi:hypothetical protein
MNSETPKKNAEPDPVRLVEASEGLHEFVAEFADGSPLTPRESRKPRAQRVQEPLLLWSDAPSPVSKRILTSRCGTSLPRHRM